MLQSLREETEGKLQMLLSPRENGLDSLFKEVTVFKGSVSKRFQYDYMSLSWTESNSSGIVQMGIVRGWWTSIVLELPSNHLSGPTARRPYRAIGYS